MASYPIDGDELTISTSAFKAHCLELLKALESRRLRRITVTRRGKPVAELTPSLPAATSLWGAHRGSVRIAEGVDLTQPTCDEPFDAEFGILHR